MTFKFQMNYLCFIEKCGIMGLGLHLQLVKKQKYTLCYGTNCLSIKPDRNWALSQKIFSHFCLTRTAQYCENLFLAMITQHILKILLLCNFPKGTSPSQAISSGAKTTN